MNDKFKERLQGFEAKFQHETDIMFKVEMRRNRLLGEWLAEIFGLAGEEKDAYAKSIILADMDEVGVEDVIRQCLKDIATHQANVTEEELREKLLECYTSASKEISQDG